MGENHPRWAIAYFGIWFRGAVCVPVDPHGEIETITNFFDNSEAKMAFIGEDFIDHFHKVEERLGHKISAVVLQDIEANDGFQEFSEWTKTERPADYDAKLPPAKNEDLAVLMYTSGTTGKPKGVPLTHGNIFYETQGCQEVMNISETEVVLSVLPLFHVFAQVVNLWVIASIGGTICYIKELTPAELENAFKTKEITLLTGVPRIWYLFHKKIFDGVAAQPFPVRWLFNKMLKLNFFLRNTFKINLGKTFFKKV
ncbi:MAG: AMP-binding protein, partial [Pyrinomonadaceae bacterium]